MLSIVVPTIEGRELWLEKALAAIEKFTSVPFELIVKRDYPACGPAWQAGGEQASGDYIWMAADDVEVMEGYDVAAIEACDRGTLPAPIIYHSNGTVQSCGTSWEMLEPDGCKTNFTRAPFMSRAQWEEINPMLDAHYYTDDLVSWRGWRLGIPTVVTYGYRMTHHLAPESRDEGRMGRDGQVFAELKQREGAIPPEQYRDYLRALRSGNDSDSLHRTDEESEAADQRPPE